MKLAGNSRNITVLKQNNFLFLVPNKLFSSSQLKFKINVTWSTTQLPDTNGMQVMAFHFEGSTNFNDTLSKGFCKTLHILIPPPRQK